MHGSRAITEKNAIIDDRPKMAGQVVINKFVFDDFSSVTRCMKPTDALTAATPSVDGIAVSKAGMS